MRSTVLLVAFWLVACGKVQTTVDPEPDAPLPPDAPPPDAPDTTPPMVTFTEKPADVVDSGIASFAWTADDPAATFECLLDGTALGACTSPHTQNNVAPGPHTFEVIASDAAGNRGSATHVWRVEPPCVPSQIELESVPDHPGWSVASGSVLHAGSGLETSVTGASFIFGFKGKGLILYGTTGPNRGKVSVQVDTMPPRIVDTFAPNVFTFQVAFPIVSGLPNADHNVRIVCETTICAIDYVDVTCN